MRNLTKYCLVLLMSFVSMNIAMFSSETKREIASAELSELFKIETFDPSRKRLHFPIRSADFPIRWADLFFRVPTSIIPEINLIQGTVKLGDFNNRIIASDQIGLSIKILPEQPLEFSCKFEICIRQTQEDTLANIVNRLWSIMQDFVASLPDNTQDMSQLRSEIDKISDRLSECTSEEKKMIHYKAALSSIPEGRSKELRSQYGALMLKNLLDGEMELAMIRLLVKQYNNELGKECDITLSTRERIV